MNQREQYEVEWVASALEVKGYSKKIVDAVKTTLEGMEIENVTVHATFVPRLEEKLKSCAEYSNLPDQHNKDIFTSKLTDVILLQVKQFDTLARVEKMKCYEIARLRRTLLEENGLNTYISAAHNSGATARSWLNFLAEQQDNGSADFPLGTLGDTQTDADPNNYICIIASSGTGKTQLAATASLTYTDATTIYLNMAGGGQRFYNPHETFTEFLITQAKAFIKNRLGNENVSANKIMGYERSDDGTSLYVRMLYHLLTGKPFIGEQPFSCLKTLKELKSSIKGRKFLVFLDEVPQKDTSHFKAVLCLRDTLRYLGIAPILMSTHTGAQDFVGKSSRNSISNWTWIISALPKYAPFPDTAKPFIMATERPLVLAMALANVLPLSETVRAIQTVLQRVKHNAWRSNPALQLVQLFCTDMDLHGKFFQAAHSLVGHHFGCLLQYSSSGDDCAIRKKSYDCGQANDFENALNVAPVCASNEPLLYLALVTWDEDMIATGNNEPHFPLVDSNQRALTVRGAFEKCRHVFRTQASIDNPLAEKADGNLLEVLAHASITLASMKINPDNDKYLGGACLKEFIPLVRKLMMGEIMDEVPAPPKFFNNLKFDWPLIPALGSSNPGLPMELAEDASCKIGFLERPPDRAMVDGMIMHKPGEKGDPFVSVECKNVSTGVTSTILNKVLCRIPGSVKCCLVLASFMKPNEYSQSTLAKVKKKCFPDRGVHKADAVSVVVWKEKGSKLEFLSIQGELFKAKNKTELLVVIVEVGLVEASVERGVKRKAISTNDADEL